MRPFWKRLDRHALFSALACAGLLGVGAVRVLSYSQTNPISIGLRESALGWLAYQPDLPWNVHFFKFIATPVLVAVIYFVFRALNRGHQVRLPGHDGPDRRIDFASPWLRLVLTTVVTLHWIPLEYMKFTREGFYPNSPLESVTINVIVLLASQAFAFFGMRHLSFDPLLRD
jgi:hypothetical protein